jgi:hypothetical protein
MRINRLALVLAVGAAASSALAQVSSTVVSFQEGVNGYAGTFDILLSERPAFDGTLGANTPNYFVDGSGANGSPDEQGVIRFDNIFGTGPGRIPQGATILRASLTVTTNGGDPLTTPPGNSLAQTNAPYAVVGLLQPASPASRRIDFGSRGPSWRQFGQLNFSASRPIAGFADPVDRTIDQNQVVSSNVMPIVQRWASGDPAHGFAIQAGYAGTTDGWQIGTSSNPDLSRRPKLDVEYTTDSVLTATFQQGVNDYTGTTMSWLKQDGNVNNPLDGALIDQAFLDGPAANSPDDRALIKFDQVFASEGGSIPNDATIVDAYVVISTGFASANARTRDGWDIHPMSIPWDLDAGTGTPSLYSEFGGGFGPTVGVDMGPALDTQWGMTSDSQAYFNITDALRQFQSGEAANYGFNIKSTALIDPTLTADDGWQIYFTGAGEIESRPQLFVRYSVASGRWIVDADGTWSDSANWQSGTAPDGEGRTAEFGSVITAARTVTVDAPQTVGRIRFDSPLSYTLAGSSAITLDNLTNDARIDVVSGSHTISSPVALASSLIVETASGAALSLTSAIDAPTQGLSKVGAGTLTVGPAILASIAVNQGTLALTNTTVSTSTTIAAGALLDLADAVAIIDYDAADPSPIAEIPAAILDGRLISSTATAGEGIGFAEVSALGLTSYAGYTFTDTSALLMRVTLLGDTNLDGSVEFADLLAVAQNYDATGTTWTTGDFNYDGVTGFSDLLALAQNFGTSALQSISINNASSQFMIDLALAKSLVPEPTTLTILGVASVLILRRR